MLLLHAAREVVEEEDFDEVLEAVRDRVDEIESLHRTRELTVCASSSIHRLSRIWLTDPFPAVQRRERWRPSMVISRQGWNSFD